MRKSAVAAVGELGTRIGNTKTWDVHIKRLRGKPEKDPSGAGCSG